MDYLTGILDDGRLKYLVDFAKDWALVNGFVTRTRQERDRSDAGQIAPFTLRPTPYPRHIWQGAKNVQEDMSELYFRVSWDLEFLESSLSSVIETDDFTRRLLDIYRQVMAEGVAQPVVLQIQRSDYMIHAPVDSSQTFKQIEANNIASSFGALSSRCTNLHRELLREMGTPADEVHGHIADNPALETVASGLAAAWSSYAQKKSGAIILVITENQNQNIADQRILEYRLRELSEARCFRISLSDCQGRLKLGQESRQLLLRSPFEDHWLEVAVVYFRSGYMPTQYLSQKEWDARLLIERSAAIKCPWIGFHVAGTKKIQQELARGNVLERFFPEDSDKVGSLRKSFAGLWGLEAAAAETAEMIAQTKRAPAEFVLKPQLEGGGNNVYGADIHRLLEKLSSVEREKYILMERLHPPVNRNYLVQAHQSVELVETVSELGTFGVLLGDGLEKRVLHSAEGGHLLRTKRIGVDEGGVMAGASCLDTPFLI